MHYWKRWFAAAACRGRLGAGLWRESDQRCTQALDFRVGRRERLQFENTKRAPVAPEKADDDGTAIQKIRKIDETAAPASQLEQGHRLARLYCLGDDACFCERLDRALHSINRARFGVRLVFATARFVLRLQ